MDETTTRRAAAVSVALAAIACLVLAGCSPGGSSATGAAPTGNDVDQSATTPTTGGATSGSGADATDEATRGDTSGADTSAVDGEGELTLESNDGTVTLGTDLPDDFPDEIPLIDGEIVSATKVDNPDAYGWVVQVLDDDDEAQQRAVDEVTAAGFSPRDSVPQVNMGAMTSTTLVNDDWQVVVASFDNQGAISYTVTALDR